jgi:hypothetical protein
MGGDVSEPGYLIQYDHLSPDMTFLDCNACMLENKKQWFVRDDRSGQRPSPHSSGCPRSGKNRNFFSLLKRQTERQGTVNCPDATDPCGLVASHIALCVWYLTDISFFAINENPGFFEKPGF